MWSDPIEEETGHNLDDSDMKEWYPNLSPSIRPNYTILRFNCIINRFLRFEVEFVPNPTRGVGQVFGFAAIHRFLQDNGLYSFLILSL